MLFVCTLEKDHNLSFNHFTSPGAITESIYHFNFSLPPPWGGSRSHSSKYLLGYFNGAPPQGSSWSWLKCLRKIRGKINTSEMRCSRRKRRKENTNLVSKLINQFFFPFLIHLIWLINSFENHTGIVGKYLDFRQMILLSIPIEIFKENDFTKIFIFYEYDFFFVLS